MSDATSSQRAWQRLKEHRARSRELAGMPPIVEWEDRTRRPISPCVQNLMALAGSMALISVTPLRSPE